MVEDEVVNFANREGMVVMSRECFLEMETGGGGTWWVADAASRELTCDGVRCPIQASLMHTSTIKGQAVRRK